jgi:hypothetical protein
VEDLLNSLDSLPLLQFEEKAAAKSWKEDTSAIENVIEFLKHHR